MTRAVHIRSVWRRKDPSGAWVQFEVTHLGKNPFGSPVATGRTPSGRMLKVSLTQMQNGDPRFEHVHDDYVEKASA